MRLMFLDAIICCGEGEYLSIAKHLLKGIRLRVRKFLLGEIENVRFHVNRVYNRL